MLLWCADCIWLLIASRAILVEARKRPHRHRDTRPKKHIAALGQISITCIAFMAMFRRSTPSVPILPRDWGWVGHFAQHIAVGVMKRPIPTLDHKYAVFLINPIAVVMDGDADTKLHDLERTVQKRCRTNTKVRIQVSGHPPKLLS
jgi:hypothetical protein